MNHAHVNRQGPQLPVRVANANLVQVYQGEPCRTAVQPVDQRKLSVGPSDAAPGKTLHHPRSHSANTSAESSRLHISSTQKRRWPFGKIDGPGKWKKPRNQGPLFFKQTNQKGHLAQKPNSQTGVPHPELQRGQIAAAAGTKPLAIFVSKPTL